MAGLPNDFTAEVDDQELLKLIWRDDLTGLYNRRFFARYMKQEADWGPGAPPLSLAMIDMDNLKRINDRLGHMSGDASLKRIGEIMLARVGERGYPIRNGGDEFCVVLPGIGRDDALTLCEELRKAVEVDPFEASNLPEGLHPSLSIGVAFYPDDAPAGGDDLTDAADKALYHSKRTGKNKVTSAHALGGEQAAPAEADALAGFPSRALVARDAAVETVQEGVAACLDGKPALLLLEGEPGTGKTRLLAEVARQGKGEQAPLVLLEKCSEVSRGEPFKAIAGLLDATLKARPPLLERVAAELSPGARVAVRGLLPSLAAAPPPKRPTAGLGTRTPPKQTRPGPTPAPGTLGAPGGPRPSGSFPAVGPPKAGPPRKGPPPGKGAPGERTAPPTEAHARPAPPTEAHGRPAAPPPEGGPRPGGSSERRPAQPGPAGSGARPRPEGAPGTDRHTKPSERLPGPAPKSPAASDRIQRPPEPVPLADALLQVLAALCRARPIVLCLDDAWHADDATLELLGRALQAREQRLLIVVTARPAVRGGDGERSPWAAFTAERPQLMRLELAPLPREGTAALARELLEGFRPGPSLIERLHAATGGNPLFIEGALRHLVETKAIVRAGPGASDGWRVEREMPEKLPLTLDDLLRGRLKVVHPDLAQLVVDVAVVGPAFEFEVVRPHGVTKRSEAEQAAAAAAAAAPAKPKLLRTNSYFSPDDLYGPAPTTPPAGEAPKAEAGAAPAADAAPKAEPAAPKPAPPPRVRTPAEEKRLRLAAALRDRRDLVFDRAAVEVLGDGKRARIPEVQEAAPPALVELLPEVATALAGAAKVVKQYAPDSKSVQDAFDALVAALQRAHAVAPAFSVSHRGNALTLNGKAVDKEKAEGPAQEAVSGLYRINRIKSLTFVDPPSREELVRFLSEAGGRATEEPLERWYWTAFAADHDLRRLGIAQKSVGLQQHSGLQTDKAKAAGALEPALVKNVVQYLVASLEAARRYAPKPGAGSLADLDRALRQVFAHAPAIAIHEGEDDDALVVNGATLKAAGLPGATELLKLLRDQRLRGLLLAKELDAAELARFVGLAARLPREWQKDQDPVAAIAADPALPNVVAGEALLQLARDLLAGPAPAPTPASPDDTPATHEPVPVPVAGDGPRSYVVPPEEEEMAPVAFKDSDLPADFEWPSDAMAQRALALSKLTPKELQAQANEAELVEVLEALLSEQRFPLAWRLIDRVATGLALGEPGERRRGAELLLACARKASSEARAAFFAIGARRLGDALQTEQDPDAFEKLAECAKAGIVDRCADADWEVAARLVYALARRKGKRGAGDGRIDKAGKRALAEVIHDPRLARLFETLETGAQQERRRAARVLEGMGTVAVDRLVQALQVTTRPRVEAFLIDMLAALAPESETALQREVTPSSDPEPTLRLLRASAVVCRDATPVLVTGLQHQDPRVQTEAVSVARNMGGKVGQGVLRFALQQGQGPAQLVAVQHLGDLARPEAVDELLDLLQRTTFVEVQRECCMALGKLSLNRTGHEKAVPVLANVLRAGGLLRGEYPEDVRAAAAWALGQMKSIEAARKALEKALDDKNNRVRLTARLTLEGKA